MHIDTDTGSWNIVLQPGVPKSRAASIGHLIFDDYASRCASSIYSNALSFTTKRNQPTQAWPADADIPHDTLTHELELKVEYLTLNAKRRGVAQLERRLVTSIVGSSWTAPVKEILVEVDQSNAQGEIQVVGGPRTQPRGPAERVEGDEDTTFTSGGNPDAGKSVNEFYVTPFEYSGAPPVKPQSKASSQIQPPNPQPGRKESSSIVSPSDSIHRPGAPGQANVISRERRPSEQFEFLVEALNTLAMEKRIVDWSAVGPTDPRLQLNRNGLACWSALRQADSLRQQLPKSGWALVFDEDLLRGSGAQSSRASRAHARAVLCVRIRLPRCSIFAIEIEPRLKETAYSLHAFVERPSGEAISLIPFLNKLRDTDGTIHAAELPKVLGSVAASAIHLHRHRYVYDGNNQKVGISADSLMRAFLRTTA